MQMLRLHMRQKKSTLIHLVIEGEKGLFIAMPSRKATDGEYRDIAHPINSETREKIQGIILQKYEQVLAEEPVEAEQPAE